MTNEVDGNTSNISGMSQRRAAEERLDDVIHKERGTTIQAVLRRLDVVLPLIVLGMAILSLIGGWMSYKAGSPRLTTRFSGGQVYVLTDDPAAQIELDLRLPLGFDQVYEGQPPPLILQISIRPSTDGPVHWAIVLGGDAALPYSLNDPAGNALPHGERRGFDNVWVQGNVKTAWYYRNAGAGRPGETPTRFPNMLGSVLAGTSHPEDTIELSVVGPARGPLLIDTGPQQHVNFPVMGVPGIAPAKGAIEYLQMVRGQPIWILVGEGGLEQVPVEARQFLESTKWYYPSSYDLTAQLSDQGPADWLSRVDPPPVAPLDWTWRGQAHLVVRAMVEQPDWLVTAQQLQFLGGVLAGIGGGLLVWAAELGFAWVRH
jgi:hypothetical protein